MERFTIPKQLVEEIAVKHPGIPAKEFALEAIQARLTGEVATGEVAGPSYAIATEPRQYFKSVYEPEKIGPVRELFGIEGDAIEVSEFDLLQKASELTGFSVDQIISEGIAYQASKYISMAVSEAKRGAKGSADRTLDLALIQACEEALNGIYQPSQDKHGQHPIRKSKVQGIANVNSKTLARWAELRGHDMLMNNQLTLEILRGDDSILKRFQDIAAKA